MYGTPSYGSSTKDRRRGRRDALSASLTILWGSEPNEEQLARADLVNVSAKGARFRILRPIPMGAWLMFNYSQKQISGRGTVRSCRMVRGSYEIGVEFANGTGWDASPANPALQGLKAALLRPASQPAGTEVTATPTIEVCLVTTPC